MTFIIPRFKVLFAQIGGDLPGLTQAFIGGYDFVVANLGYIAGSFVLGLVLLIFYFKTPVGWSHLSRFLLKVPLVGEESGSLPEVLERTSGYYEKRVDSMVTTMTRLLEPILIVAVGAIVLGVVLALYLPIFMISDVHQ